jgi:hypothetical protein
MKSLRRQGQECQGRGELGPVAGSGSTFSAPFHHVWPSELDLMARLAWMRPAADSKDSENKFDLY